MLDFALVCGFLLICIMDPNLKALSCRFLQVPVAANVDGRVYRNNNFSISLVAGLTCSLAAGEPDLEINADFVKAHIVDGVPEGPKGRVRFSEGATAAAMACMTKHANWPKHFDICRPNHTKSKQASDSGGIPTHAGGASDAAAAEVSSAAGPSLAAGAPVRAGTARSGKAAESATAGGAAGTAEAAAPVVEGADLAPAVAVLPPRVARVAGAARAVEATLASGGTPAAGAARAAEEAAEAALKDRNGL